MRVICTKTGECEMHEKLRGIEKCPGDGGCRWYTRISEPIEVEDVPEKWQTLYGASQDALRDTIHECGDAWEAFDSAIAAFEELAGEHQTLRIRYAMHQDAPQPEQPGPGWYWVKGHWRSRTAPEARSEAAPTEDTAEAVSESLAQPQGQPEPFSDGVTVWYCEGCGMSIDHYPCRVCHFPTVPSDDLTGLAVCRWEVGRWGI